MSIIPKSGLNARPVSLYSPGFSKSGKPILVGIAALLLMLAILPWLPGIKFYYLQVIILVFWYASLGTSWGISGGYGGLHSVGNAAFVGVGAYSSTLLYINLGISPWLGMLVGMVLAGLLAVIVGYPTFRFGLRGDYFTLASLAFGLLIFELANGSVWLTGGPQGIPISYVDEPLMFQFQDRRVFYYIAMAIWLVALYVSYRIRRSTFGFQILAVRDDEAAAERGGISVSKTKLGAFVVTAMLTSIAGTFYAQFFLFIDPKAVMGLTLSIQIMIIAALGGMGTFMGATVGAIILVPISQYFASQFSGVVGLDLALYGLILVLVMMYMPFGILGHLRKSPRWRKAMGW